MSDLIVENGISIVVLAEYSANIDELIALLGVHGVSMKRIPTIGCDRISMLADKQVCFEPQLQTDRASFQIIDKNIILCGIHLNSQIYAGNVERRKIDIELIIENTIALENSIKTKNTIIVGDFNINPYDERGFGYDGG